jgi:hypothetical protein
MKAAKDKHGERRRERRDYGKDIEGNSKKGGRKEDELKRKKKEGKRPKRMREE